ncbi:hypothetical protein JTE90_001502 [Oedothorax gibbosus]|uniref:Uncharacterized protein n=1 Tax=Oedothorax gibbosus TaxID=931172 RepID=A0AAV6UMN6_9ARAC|nr:hypothetical protein JTE90_001502 [Oedothorax gibbosus]
MKENFGINAEDVENGGEFVAEVNIPNLKMQHEMPENNEHDKMKANFGINAEDFENTGEIVVEGIIPNLEIQHVELEGNKQMKANLGKNIADFEVRDGVCPEAISVPQVQKAKRIADVLRNATGKFFLLQVNRYRIHRAKMAFTSTLADADNEELESSTDLNVAYVNTSNLRRRKREPEDEPSATINKRKKWKSFKTRFSHIKKFFKKN